VCKKVVQCGSSNFALFTWWLLEIRFSILEKDMACKSLNSVGYFLDRKVAFFLMGGVGNFAFSHSSMSEIWFSRPKACETVVKLLSPDVFFFCFAIDSEICWRKSSRQSDRFRNWSAEIEPTANRQARTRSKITEKLGFRYSNR